MRTTCFVVLAACGGMEQPISSDCHVEITGAVTGTDTCTVYLCSPTGENYQSLDLSSSTTTPVNYHLAPEVATAFTAGMTYDLATLRSTSGLSVNASKQYVARAGGTASVDEHATLMLTSVTPPSGTDVCSGYATGTLTVALVEIDFGTTPPTIGTGRVNATVTIH